MVKTNELGEIAMELIAEHPLYASTCGISYEQAIAVAIALTGTKDLRGVKKELDRIDKLSSEELRTEIEQDNLIREKNYNG